LNASGGECLGQIGECVAYGGVAALPDVVSGCGSATRMSFDVGVCASAEVAIVWSNGIPTAATAVF
jgi:hypothetical protein